MKYKEFIADLNKEKHVYLLAGAEEYYIDKAREAILSKIFPNGEGRADGLIKLDCDKKIDINQIIGALETTPFFSEKNVILVKNTTLFKGKSKSEEESDAPKKDLTTEKLIKVLSDMLETNYVIFTTRDEPDKRKKLYKTVVKFGSVLEADALRPWQINEWLNEKLREIKKTFEPDARNYFNEVVGVMPEVSLNYLNNELEKISLYVNGARITKKELQRIMTDLPEVSNFALMDAINEKNLKKAMYLLRAQLMERNKEPLIIALLVRHVRLLMRAKYYINQGVKGRDLARPLDLNPFIAQKIGEYSKKFSEEILREVYLMLADADYLFKIGKSGPELLERIIFKLIQG